MLSNSSNQNQGPELLAPETANGNTASEFVNKFCTKEEIQDIDVTDIINNNPQFQDLDLSEKDAAIREGKIVKTNILKAIDSHGPSVGLDDYKGRIAGLVLFKIQNDRMVQPL